MDDGQSVWYYVCVFANVLAELLCTCRKRERVLLLLTNDPHDIVLVLNCPAPSHPHVSALLRHGSEGVVKCSALGLRGILGLDARFEGEINKFDDGAAHG